MQAYKGFDRDMKCRSFQYKEGDTYLLYAKYRDKGYATLRPHPYIDSLGRQQTRQHLYWTERGKVFEIPEDFAACYQVSEEMYRRLKPFIRIGEKYRLRA